MIRRWSYALILGFASYAHADPLTIERIFAAPDLSGPALRNLKVAPDGRRVTFLQGKSDNKDQFDLWAFDVGAGRAAMLVDSRAFVSDSEALSAEEAARRVRQFHSRSKSLDRRRADRTGTADHARRRGTRQQRRGRIHRAGGNGTQHRILVVARRVAYRLCAHRRLARAGSRALRNLRRSQPHGATTLSRGGHGQRVGGAANRRAGHREAHRRAA